MAETHLKAARPLSPHLTIFRPLITMVMSIVHRITGMGLYVGMLFLAWWLLAMGSPKGFEVVNTFYESWFGRLILLGFTWALLHHMLGGVRHLIWDTGAGFGPRARNGLAWATLGGSILLTIVVWIVGYSLR